MDTSASKQIKFHTELLPKWTLEALDFLSKEKWFEKSAWYLAGGTALSLQSGHRQSVDLDFFTTEKKFNVKVLLTNFLNYKDWQATVEEDNTLYGELLGAKVSFIAYPFFVPKQKFIKYGSIRILQPLDIAVMKIVAISQRGRKRDFFDLYWCARNVAPLIEIIKKLPEQYPSVAHDYHHILKSMVYFEDAESDPDPEVKFEASWKKVKKFFEKEIPIITEELVFRNHAAK